MNHIGQISEDKIGDLGRAIAAKTPLLLQVYLASAPIFEKSKTKHYYCLRDSGVISESESGVLLTREARHLLDKIAQKAHRRHVMPDIENWKMDVQQYSERALNAAYELDDSEDEYSYLEAVTHLVRDLADALNQEMASIEYIINSELSDTTNIKNKRIILSSLIKKITAQIDKIKSLSREGLKECHAGNSKVEMILSIGIYDVVDKCLNEMDISLEKTVALMDKLNKEYKQQNARVWRLHHSLRNNQYNPENTPFTFEDLEQHGLAFGGMDISEELTNTDINMDTNNFFLLMTVGKISESIASRAPERVAKLNNNNVKKDDEPDPEQPPTEQQELGYSFLGYNSKNPRKENLSVVEFWNLHNLDKIINQRAFLSLILHQCKNDLMEDNIVNTNDRWHWKLYLKTVKPSAFCDTVYVSDARFIRYSVNEPAPSKDEVWTRD